jgi:hypothetical protein
MLNVDKFNQFSSASFGAVANKRKSFSVGRNFYILIYLNVHVTKIYKKVIYFRDVLLYLAG